MTNNKNKTAIETIVEFVKGGMPYMAAKPYDRDLYSSIAELDARLSVLETSAKASEPKEDEKMDLSPDQLGILEAIWFLKQYNTAVLGRFKVAIEILERNSKKEEK